MEQVLRYIEEHRDEYIELLKTYCRQPSISAQNVGMREMARLDQTTLDGLGAATELIDSPGYPFVYGEIPGESGRTITFYNHYDVQPPDPLAEWESEPFEPTLRGDRLFARGVGDNKGSLLSRVCAVDAFLKVHGKLPLNVKFIHEGEEEVGSPNLAWFRDSFPQKLATDGIVWEGGSKNIGGGPLQVALGVKGMLYVELSCRCARSDLHSLNAAIVPNAAWRLNWALGSLKGPDDRILIEGFYDDIQPPPPQDMAYLESLAYDEQAMLESMGRDCFIGELTGMALKEKYLYQPTCNIAGQVAGYIGEGAKTVLPATATAKLDFRLVQGQSYLKVADLLRAHLKKHGFEDIQVTVLSGKDPYRTSSDNHLVRAVLDNVERVYGMPPVVYPNLAGTTAMGTFCHGTGIPAVCFGICHDDSRIHAPNENIFLEDYINGIKLTALVMREFADS